ncbi:hypothetical protein [Paraburkholderia rhizosphaerae]|uniref:Uncharacterized protein n=1 Tax=Paraburkholderia rhizosphaerae TaxID=480658 RepID=A0A4R8M042_9BURK|nr:hypothetical protein [Paraburkholderia rhizosphaerae]TDY54172.1 hypothetical protein BX592_102319 [Paraburkholderia rhizosphaerae]
MAAISNSRESNAAARYMRATRDVEQAFRLVRGEGEGERPISHSDAVSRLERALEELNEAELLFDALTRGVRNAH